MSESAIALLLAQHAMVQEQRPEPPKVTITFSPNPLPKASPKREAKAVPTVQTARSMHTVGIQPGTIDAREFMVRYRRSVSREETIKAIQAYIGYDVRGDFGSQEQAAKRRATAELQPQRNQGGMTRDEQRSAARSLHGFVAGVPNVGERHTSDLLAREAHTVEEIQELQKAMDHMPEGRAKVAAGVELNRLRCLLSNVRASLGVTVESEV